MKTISFIIKALIGIYFLLNTCEVIAFERPENEYIKAYHNGYTHLFVDFQDMTLKIIEFDDNPHQPIFSRNIFRGKFKLEHIKDDFFSIHAELPGKKCINSMEVSTIPSNTNEVEVKFLLGESKYRYLIKAKNIITGSAHVINYPETRILHLPCGSGGYTFAILPKEDFMNVISGITYGFQGTLKYLELPFLLSMDAINSPCCVDITLPLFNDDIFDLWCIEGDILQINNQVLNEKIIWHG